jgi:hypothetical protein
MVNRNIYLRISVMTLVFGFMAIGTLEAQTDSRLNGRWVSGGGEIETEYRFNNGNFESTIGEVPMQRGTYTTNNGEITVYETHIFGDALDAIGISGLESKWYSRDEFFIAIRPILARFGLSDRQINEAIHDMMSTLSYTYSVDANTLILSSTDSTIIFNKR